MSPRAEQQELVPALDLHLRIERDGHGFAVIENGDRLGVCPSARFAGEMAFSRAHRRAFEFAALMGWMRLHGMVATIGDRRVVAIGRSGVGKTTLAFGLIAAGWSVDGDESFITRGGECLAVPRRLHAKPGTATVVPDAGPWIEAGDTLPDVPDLWLVDPDVAGRLWSLTVAPVDDVVVLTRDGVDSRVDPATTPEVLGVVRDEVFRTVDSQGTIAGALAALIGGARLSRLTIGTDGHAPARLAEHLL